jgi:hypothetical protein
MNLKLIFLLSLMGLAMAIGTVYVIPSNIEAMLWPVIFVICAFLIARGAPGKFFLHGFLVGLTNWVWVAGTHVILSDAYTARHVKEVAAMRAMPLPDAPITVLMRLYDLPVPGASGVVIGLLAWVAAKVVRRGSRRSA